MRSGRCARRCAGRSRRCFILGIVVPYEALIIPLYYQLRSLGLTDTYWSLILPQSALSLAFGVYWMRGFFRSVPRSLLEAGAGGGRLVVAALVGAPAARAAGDRDDGDPDASCGTGTSS